VETQIYTYIIYTYTHTHTHTSGDVETRRNGAMSLGNLAMEAPGRTGMLEVFSIVQVYVCS